MELQLSGRRPRPARRSTVSPFRVATPLPRSGWEEFIERYGLPMRRTADRLLVRLGQPASAERVDDLLQEAYCRLLAGGPQRLAELTAAHFPQVVLYLGRLVRSVAVDQWRTEQAVKRGGGVVVRQAPPGSRPLAERVIDYTANPEERLLAAELLRLSLSRAQAAAPGGPKARRNLAIVRWALLGGWNSREIANHLGDGLSPRTIESLLSQVRGRLCAARPVARRRGRRSDERRDKIGR